MQRCIEQACFVCQDPAPKRTGLGNDQRLPTKQNTGQCEITGRSEQRSRFAVFVDALTGPDHPIHVGMSTKVITHMVQRAREQRVVGVGPAKNLPSSPRHPLVDRIRLAFVRFDHNKIDLIAVAKNDVD